MSSPRLRSPSIGDVARLAGVSAQTVSRVSNGADRVSEATRERVLQAMSQLGYSPNHAARALRNGAFRTIGLLAHRFERTGEALTMKGVIDAARAEEYGVTVVDVTASEDDRGWERAAARLTSQAIDGLIVIRAEHETPELLALPPALPVVVSDSRLIGHYSSVVADQVQGTTDAVRHLIDLGHRRIHHIGGPADSEPADVRLASWRRVLQDAGLPEGRLWRGDWSARSGYELGQLIAEDPDVTAVFCANDETAIGLIRALLERGVRVPQDVSVVGFDGISLAEFTYPPLTTVKQDFHMVGNELVRMVLERMRSTGPVARERVLVPTELIVRGTTAPVRSASGR
ncbi:LacI family DNA-binding transcriptional regulator [Microbacterium paludicola]|uniref:LacI family DNA-binding transcriptional regulator n=1 Tax=Microbacterium paludicola TaxID=300019 RepID=UPI003879CE0C